MTKTPSTRHLLELQANIQALLERDRAAAPVDPQLLTEAAKNAKILALQGRIVELESILTFFAHLLQSIETIVAEDPTNARCKRIAHETQRRWEGAMPVRQSEPLIARETGAGTYMRRSL